MQLLKNEYFRSIFFFYVAVLNNRKTSNIYP